MIEKLLPQNVEAEMGVLGSIIIDPEAITQVADFLFPQDFYRDAHKTIYEAIVHLYQQREPADSITLSDELARWGKLEDIGGASYITSLVNNVPTSGNIEYYGRIVERTAILRRLIHSAGQIAAIAYEEGDADAAVSKAEKILYGVSRRVLPNGFISLSDIMLDYLQELDTLHENRHAVPGVPTGYDDLDNLLGGMQKTDLVILAGRPGIGKTALGLNMAYNAATQHKKSSAVFSLEMGRRQLARRLMSMQSGIDMQRLRMGWIQSNEWDTVMNAGGKLAELPIWINDTSGNPIASMRSQLRRLLSERKHIDLVVVDYLQLIESDEENGRHRENRVQEISTISRELKGFAKEFDVPVLALAQLSRKVEERQNKMPQLSDLKECVVGSTRLIDAKTGKWVAIKDIKSGDEILAMNAKQKIARFPVADVWSTGTKPVYRLKTRTGKTITATANHPFFTGTGWKPLQELQAGDCVATAMKLPLHGEQHEDRADLCRLLGYLAGDGGYQNLTSLSFISADPETFQDAKVIVAQYFPSIKMLIRPKKGKAEECYFTWTGAKGYGKPFGNPLREWLRSLGLIGQRDRTKHVPDWVFESGDIGISHFIAGYLSSDGCVKVHRNSQHSPKWSIQFDTVSHRLAEDIQALLLSIGVVASINDGYQSSKGTRPIYRVQIAEKAENLRCFALQVPAQGKKGRLLQEMIATLPEQETNISFFGLPKELAPVVQRLSNWHYRNYGKKQNRSNVLELAREVEDETLAMWATSDLLWEEIKSIEKAGEEEVFDITVPDAHNFIANGIVTHNSGAIEENADVVMFVYRDDYYAEIEQRKSERPNIADVVIAKHRNGPTGAVKLFFKADQTRFYNVEETK